MAESFPIEGVRDRHLRLWFFTEVQNSGDLLRRVQTKSVEPECSFINASLVADLWLVRAAAFKAVADERRGRLKTHSLHGELVYNLSGSRHIGESFRQYGLAGGVTNVLVGRFNATEEQENAICGMVDGKLEALSKLPNYIDTDQIEKILGRSPAERQLGDLAGSIVTRMAVRDS